MSNKKVIYHANCNDGFTAAYLFWLDFKDEVDYIPMHYGAELDTTDFDSDTIVYIADFSFPREYTYELARLVKYIWVLDHHKTAEANLINLDIPNVRTVFDMTKSGAQLTWEFLYRSEDYSPLVAYTADRDLWKWKLPNSKEINAYIATVPYDFCLWGYLDNELKHDLTNVRKAGMAVLAFQQKQIDSAVKHATEHKLNGYFILAVNSTVNFSEVAGELAKDRDFGVAWFQRSDGKFQYSLRSEPNGSDVSEVAKLFGGGGHKHAAGFESDTQVLERV